MHHAFHLLLATCIATVLAVPIRPAAAQSPAGPPAGEGEIVIEPSPPPSTEERHEMESWHRRWRRETEPVRETLAALHRAASTRRPPDWQPECRELGRTLVAVDRERVFPAPVYSLTSHLSASLDHLARAAALCLGGRWAAVEPELEAARRASAQAELALRRYGLTP